MSAVNMKYLDEACGGDPELRSELVSIFIDQMNGVAADLRSLLDADKMDALARSAHQVKSTALSLGMEDMAVALKRIEIVAKKIILRDSPESVSPQYRELYASQMKSLADDINRWTEDNLSKKSLTLLIDFCEAQANEAIKEVSA